MAFSLAIDGFWTIGWRIGDVKKSTCRQAVRSEVRESGSNSSTDNGDVVNEEPLSDRDLVSLAEGDLGGDRR
jgi:hypothetical protein